jgi:trigger factor
MNVTRETKAAQNDILKIELTKEDYLDGFEKKLKKYSKEANIKGFRKGLAPAGMIKKMYGESILADELNHLADTALQNFIKENNIRLLGRPLLAENQEMLDIKPNEDKAYVLNFEIGFEPSYTIALDGSFSKYEIKVTGDMVDKEIENVMKHFTKLEDSAEPVAEGDTIYFNFDNGADLKGESFCSTDELTEAGAKSFISQKMGDKVEGKALELFNNEKLDVKRYILHVQDSTEEVDAQIAKSMTFEITNVKKRVTPETLAPEQISQVTRDESKTTMEDLKQSLEEDIKKQYHDLSQNFLRNDVYEYALENTKMDLPIDFLKKWIASEEENQMSPELVEKEFANIEKSIKWDLISAKFALENSVKVEIEEIKNEYKTRYVQYFMQSGYNPPADQLDKFADEAMKDQKNVRKTYEQLLDTKVLDGMSSQVKTKSIVFTEDEFIAESKKRNEKRQAQNPAHGEAGHVHDENCGHNH